jgi:hypothetical protein
MEKAVRGRRLEPDSSLYSIVWPILEYAVKHKKFKCRDVSIALRVPLRRIYDVVLVFEALGCARRKGCGTWVWMGADEVGKLRVVNEEAMEPRSYYGRACIAVSQLSQLDTTTRYALREFRELMGVPGRRAYDIFNVLCALGVIELSEYKGKRVANWQPSNAIHWPREGKGKIGMDETFVLEAIQLETWVPAVPDWSVEPEQFAIGKSWLF